MPNSSVLADDSPSFVEPRNVLIVGSGKMGLLHGSLVNATRTNRVVGLVDRSFQARRLVRAAGLPAPVFKSLADAMRSVRTIDTCFVCTPPSSHYEVTRAALEAGLDVFVEKPLTLQGTTSADLAARAKAAGRMGVVGYVRRYSPVLARLRADGLASARPTRIRVSVLSPQFVGAGDSGAARGGVEWDLLPHAVDAACWVGGSIGDPKVLQVTRRGREAIHIRGTVDRVALELEADWACRDVRKVELRAEVELTDGSVYGCDEDVVWRRVGSTRTSLFHRRDAPAPWFDVAGAEFSGEVHDVLGAFGSRRPTVGASLEEGAKIDRFIEDCVSQGTKGGDGP